MAIFMDAEKAFDWVEWGFWKYTLARIGVGPSFLQWIDMLYKDQTVQITYAGSKCSLVNIQRGVCQGCPLFPLLFDIIIEMLALAVRANRDIQGVLINNIEHK